MAAEVSTKQGASGEMRCRRRGRSDVSTKQRQRQPARAECRVQSGQRCGSIYGAANRLDTGLGDTSAAAPVLTSDSASADAAACAIRYQTAKIRVSRRAVFFSSPPQPAIISNQHRPDYEIIPPRRAAPRWQKAHPTVDSTQEVGRLWLAPSRDAVRKSGVEAEAIPCRRPRNPSTEAKQAVFSDSRPSTNPCPRSSSTLRVFRHALDAPRLRAAATPRPTEGTRDPSRSRWRRL